jgi:deoxyribodipyrimidine photo-lyase
MVLFWHRRDLRIEDNAGLYKALKNDKNVQPVFIFDRNILGELPKDDQRVLFIHQELERLKTAYGKQGSDLWVFYGTPTEVFKQITSDHKVTKVYTNRDYEPYAKERDQEIYSLLNTLEIDFIGTKDHVIFEKSEVVKDDETAYRVFSPYMRAWKKKLRESHLASFKTEEFFDNLHHAKNQQELISLPEMGFENQQKVDFPSREVDEKTIEQYHDKRDLPGIKGTTRMSLHLRFGTISIRSLARQAERNEKYLNELIWRDFYQMIIHHFPKSANDAFKEKYDNVPWINDKEQFKAWCEGKTGYPIVDAGMRELNKTGFMHNRIRMVVASFLTKHLLIDWRWGEAYFAEKLLDFELASNVGGWQWAASSGVDAQPYFRVFNPDSQQKKFDKDFVYIKKWVPEFESEQYPAPIVNHKEARERAISTYKEAVNQS